jgi:hypothetical protein
MLSDPEALGTWINEAWETADCDQKCMLGDVAEGLYWHTVEWQGGQGCPMHRIRYDLDYSPGMGEGPPEAGDEWREAAFHVYLSLATAAAQP